MRVLQLHNEQLGPGGASTVVVREAEALRRRGHHISTLLLHTEHLADAAAIRQAGWAIWNRPFARTLRETLTAEQPDVAHVHTPFPLMSPAVFRELARAGIPTVTTVHSFRWSCLPGTLLRDGSPCHDCVGKTVKWKGVARACYHDSRAGSAALAASLALHRTIRSTHNVAAWIVMSQFTRNLLVREGVAKDRIVVKPNTGGAPPLVDPTSPREPWLLFIGRLTEEKGIRTLLHAWSREPGLPELRIAGDGPLRHLVDEAAANDPRITPLGWRSSEQVMDLLARSSALIFASEWYEAGTTLVMIEAFSQGTPIVVSDVGNFTEAVIDGANGAHFCSGDPDSLADAVQRLLCLLAVDGDGIRRNALAAAAAYEEEAVTDALEGVLSGAIRSVVALR
jgi:glycosyltransferase involved in cell wall biosynthesis